MSRTISTATSHALSRTTSYHHHHPHRLATTSSAPRSGKSNHRRNLEPPACLPRSTSIERRLAPPAASAAARGTGSLAALAWLGASGCCFLLCPAVPFIHSFIHSLVSSAHLDHCFSSHRQSASTTALQPRVPSLCTKLHQPAPAPAFSTLISFGLSHYAQLQSRRSLCSLHRPVTAHDSARPAATYQYYRPSQLFQSSVPDEQSSNAKPQKGNNGIGLGLYQLAESIKGRRQSRRLCTTAAASFAQRASQEHRSKASALHSTTLTSVFNSSPFSPTRNPHSLSP